MRRINNLAVSHIIGFIFSLALASIVITSSLFLVQSIVTEKIGSAAEIYADYLAEDIVNSIVDVCTMKETYPDCNYTKTKDIPDKLLDHFSYYIEIDDKYVYVNSTDGNIQVKKTNFGMPKRVFTNADGRLYGGAKTLNIYSKKSDYVYKFDFGTDSSKSVDTYLRVTQNTLSPTGLWPAVYNNWKYRTPIWISNPTGKSLEKYQVLVQLNKNNFDHSLVNSDLSDIRFTDENDDPLYYWVERWYSNDTRASRIWVNVSTIPDSGCFIYMYYNNSNLALPNNYNNGDRTFLFFDNFTSDLSKWYFFYEDADSDIYFQDGRLVLVNGSAVISKTLIDAYAQPFIVETKAKSVGDYHLEASLFTRCSNQGLAYTDAIVFFSGSFEHGSNLTLSYFDYDRHKWYNLSKADSAPINSEWFRLSYTVNKSDDVINRFYYGNFTKSGHMAGVTYANIMDNRPYFGLCIANTTYDNLVTAYYDWVFVRKFGGNTLNSDSREAFEPVANVYGIQSQLFWWEDTANIDSKSYIGEELGDDLVFSDSDPADFKITGLNVGQDYSLVFTVGDKKGPIVENMIIQIYGGDVTGSDLTKTFDNIDCTNLEPFKKTWFTDIYPKSDGTISVRFDDQDSSSYYWTVCELTIEKGERKISIVEG